MEPRDGSGNAPNEPGPSTTLRGAAASNNQKSPEAHQNLNRQEAANLQQPPLKGQDPSNGASSPDDKKSSHEGWQKLRDKSYTYDSRYIGNWNDEIENLLFFSGLFSAVVTAFIIETYSTLQPSPKSTTLTALQRISQQLDSMADGTPSQQTSVSPQSEFRPAATSIWINTLWFASLVCSLIAASWATFVRQWLREYTDGLKTYSPRTYARIREFRFRGMTGWFVFQFMAFVPVILQLALILFLCGLLLFLEPLNPIVFRALVPIIGSWLIVWLATTVAPTFSASCPYKSPQAQLIYLAYRASQRLTAHTTYYLMLIPWTLRQKFERYPSPLELERPFTPSQTRIGSWEERELIVKLKTSSDVHALVGIDNLYLDDGMLEEIYSLCLSNLSGLHATVCVTKMLQNRAPTSRGLVEKRILPFTHEDLQTVSDEALLVVANVVADVMERETATRAAELPRLMAMTPQERWRRRIEDELINADGGFDIEIDMRSWIKPSLAFLHEVFLSIEERKLETRSKDKVYKLREQTLKSILTMFSFPIQIMDSLVGDGFRFYMNNTSLLRDMDHPQKALDVDLAQLVRFAQEMRPKNGGHVDTTPWPWIATVLRLALLIPVSEKPAKELATLIEFVRKDVSQSIVENGLQNLYDPHRDISHDLALRLKERHPTLWDDSLSVILRASIPPNTTTRATPNAQ